MTITTPVLETARLILRPLELADADQVQLLFPHWDVVKHLNNRVPWPYPPDGARQFYEHVAFRRWRAVSNGAGRSG